MKLKFRKTPTDQRDAYKYYGVDGKVVVTLRPDPETKVEAIHIKLLHSMDDAEVYNNLKNRSATSPPKDGHGIEISVELPRSSRWVLSLDQMMDETGEAFHENREMLRQAYKRLAEDRSDVQRELLYEAVEYLDEAQRELFRLRYVEEMTETAIAKLYHVHVSRICRRLKRMETDLKDIIFKKILP